LYGTIERKRQQMVKFVLNGILILSLFGCALKPEPESSKSLYLVLKTPLIRLADYAFIKRHSNYTRLHVLNAGQVVLDMRLSEQLCFNGPCYERTLFNKRFFKNEHYPMLLDDILEAKAIYDGVGLEKIDGGFIQSIELKNSQIFYQVLKSSVRFEDKIQNIKILIKF